MAGNTDLSELEGAVLGLVWREGPMTAYAVRASFAGSPTGFFSTSTGAIYPLVRRLETRRLVRSRARREDGRGTRLLEITDRGVETLRRWAGPPVEPWMAAAPLDPIRTRLLFGDILAPAARRRLLDDAASALETEVAMLEVRRRADRSQGPREAWLATTGALAVARARLRWVRWARTRLSPAGPRPR